VILLYFVKKSKKLPIRSTIPLILLEISLQGMPFAEAGVDAAKDI
jgi:hypothetical protein